MKSTNRSAWRGLRSSIAASVAVLLLVSACGSSGSEADESTGAPSTESATTSTSESAVTTTDAESAAETEGTSADATSEEAPTSARDLLPADIRERGFINAGIALDWPPFEFKDDDGNYVGFDIEIVDALSDVLGVEFKYTEVGFAPLIQGTGNGRFEFGMHNFADTEERRETVNFIDYYNIGYSLLVKKGSDTKITPTDMCGFTVALTEGSSQIKPVEEMSAQCEKDGKPAIGQAFFADTGTTYVAVANGHADAFITTIAVGKYVASTDHPELEMIEGSVPNMGFRSGFITPKDNPQMAIAIKAAFDEIMADGRFHDILAKWGVEAQALEEALINDGLGL